MRQRRLNLSHRLDKIHRVIIVFLYTGRDRKNIGIKDNILRRKVQFLRQNAEAIKFKNRTILERASSMASSIFTSIIAAPASTC